MWKLNMAFCIAVGFGCFIIAIIKTIQAEGKKRR